MASPTPKTSRKPRLQRHAFGEPAGDADLHHALVARLAEQAVDANAVDAELLGDLHLGEAGDEIEPGGAGGELLVAIDGERVCSSSWLSLTSTCRHEFFTDSDAGGPREFRAACRR